MNFYKYINEAKSFDKIFSILQKDCSYYFNLLKKLRLDGRIFRATKDNISDIKKFQTLTNRQPRDMNPVIHALLDKEFYKKFGWYPRSQGVFAQMGHANDIEIYGKIYYIFPIGKFSILGAENIKDLFMYLQDDWLLVTKQDYISDALIEKYREYIQDEIIPQYTTNYKKLYYSSSEISINCKEYYLVNEYLIRENYRTVFNFER